MSDNRPTSTQASQLVDGIYLRGALWMFIYSMATAIFTNPAILMFCAIGAGIHIAIAGVKTLKEAESIAYAEGRKQEMKTPTKGTI